MISDLLNQTPKELISDSLKESLLQEGQTASVDAFITVAFVPQNKNDSLIGNLVGVEFSSNPKFDIKVSLHDAFNFISNILLNESNNQIVAIILAFSEKNITLVGPYNIANSKILEIDSINKACVLAIDLIKNN